VVGTTARLGGQRPVLKSPEILAQHLIPLSGNNPVAILFGPEDRGLTNNDLKRCHQLVNIPTVNFTSLNLAQAVMVVCYSLSTANLTGPPVFTPRLAKRIELDQMYDELTAALVHIGYVRPDNPDYWMTRIRRFFARLHCVPVKPASSGESAVRSIATVTGAMPRDSKMAAGTEVCCNRLRFTVTGSRLREIEGNCEPLTGNGKP
jgi:hypothetical protein